MTGGRSHALGLDMENLDPRDVEDGEPTPTFPAKRTTRSLIAMKYMLLIFNTPQDLEAAGHDMSQIGREVDELMSELNETGEFIGGEALAHADRAKTVRVRDGAPVVTDGPFAEAKEQLAGYCLFECETEERALEIAARWPDARINGVELRPLMTHDAADV
jgi:hypothetical protein